MYPPIFGTLFHDMMLMIAEGYPHNPKPEHQESMRLLFLHLFKNLPCSDCSMSAIAYIKHHPIDVSGKKALLSYLVTLHNHINEKLGKKNDWTVLEALAALAARHRSNLSNLARADQMRVEDHQLMKKVMEENNAYRLQLGLPLRNDVVSETDYDLDLDSFYASFSNNASSNSSQNPTFSYFLVSVVSILAFLFIWIMIWILLRY
jgi:hypothetical protein